MNIFIALLIVSQTPNEYRLDVDKVYDGDTIVATINLGFNVTLAHESIRLEGFDAWEISRVRRTIEPADWDTEIERGKLAKAVLQEIMERGSPYLRVKHGRRGAYGRIVGRLIIYPAGEETGIDVAQAMIDAGMDRTKPVDEEKLNRIQAFLATTK